MGASEHLIKWRKGCRESLLGVIRSALDKLPQYKPGRGQGANWPLPSLSTTNTPLFVSPQALPALVSIYEEYVDRYFVSHDYIAPPRRWLHDNVPADPGVLEYVFPLLTGSASASAREVLLIRLVWLIQQCPGLVEFRSSNEIVVTTTVGTIGVTGDRVLYRFSPEPVRLLNPVSVTLALAAGHIRVFDRTMNELYQRLDAPGRIALTLLASRIRTKALMRCLYDDGLVTGSHLSYMRNLDDKILSIELALRRSECPADTLMNVLVPEYLTRKEYLSLFGIPWKRELRNKFTADYLIRKMPLVRQILSQT